MKKIYLCLFTIGLLGLSLAAWTAKTTDARATDIPQLEYRCVKSTDIANTEYINLGDREHAAKYKSFIALEAENGWTKDHVKKGPGMLLKGVCLSRYAKN